MADILSVSDVLTQSNYHVPYRRVCILLLYNKATRKNMSRYVGCICNETALLFVIIWLSLLKATLYLS